MPGDWADYQLLDFGNGRKLERFGELVFDRPAPQAADPRTAPPELWRAATAKYTGKQVGEGYWRRPAGTPRDVTGVVRVPLSVDGGPVEFRMQIEPTPAGQVGLFPEQFANWQWLARQLARTGEPLRVLNLFAYTGGSTLASAAAGAEVTHVDASKPAVAAARSNAELSGLAEAPIRWIVEDVLRYCRREIKRGRQYHAVVLDPPSYGHGPRGEQWQLARHLLPLLRMCRELTAADRRVLLLTCHTPGIGPAELSAYLADGLFGHCGQGPRSGTLQLTTAAGRHLPSGVFARWPGV